MLIGSHVGMKGKDMFLGSVKEALSYQAFSLVLAVLILQWQQPISLDQPLS